MSLTELRGAIHMWEILNLVSPKRKTPLTGEELKKKILLEEKEAMELQEFVNKPISEVFPQKQPKP